MSAEKPEVGDVWETEKQFCSIPKGTKIFIIGETFINDEFQCLCSKNFRIWITDVIQEAFIENCLIYIGKSKANINDLFEVKND